MSLAGAPIHDVVGIAVAAPAADLRPTVLEILDGLIALIRLRVPDERVVLDDDQLGAGYGRRTVAADEAARLLARTEGIIVDPIYTAKALAGLVRGSATDGSPVRSCSGTPAADPACSSGSIDVRPLAAAGVVPPTTSNVRSRRRGGDSGVPSPGVVPRPTSSTSSVGPSLVVRATTAAPRASAVPALSPSRRPARHRGASSAPRSGAPRRCRPGRRRRTGPRSPRT